VDKQEQLTALAGTDGADVLKGAQMAVDDLENAGIVAKDLDTDTEAAPEAEAADVDQSGQDPVEKETTKPDLAAMKEAISKLAAASKEEAAAEKAEDTPDPEVVQLREIVTTRRQEVDELKQHVEAQAVAQNKAIAETKDLPVRFAELQAEHDKALEVVSGLFDLVMDYSTGKKEVVIERNGSGSAHDPEGAALQRQVEEMARGKMASRSGDYAGERLLPSD